MSSSTATHTRLRLWTPARIAALLAIAFALGGLAQLRSSQAGGAVAVPAGARAGELALHPCRYHTEVGDVRADCGTLVVRENRADPRSRLIALPVKRIRARSPHPAEPIFRLEGGPGQTNLRFPYASRYSGDHDLVLVGYRGVDGSARLDCPEVTDARRHAADLISASAVDAAARAVRACAQRLRSDGYDLAGYTIPERVDDLEAARRALGYRRVDLLSESFGTRLAMVYAWRHPRAIHRSVMIGVNPPGHFVYDPAQTDEQLLRFSALCACGDLAGSIRRTAAHLPARWGPFPIHRGNVELGSFFGLTDASAEASPVSAPMTLGAWGAAARGDAGGLWLQSLASALLLPRAQVWGDSAAMARIDAGAVARHFASHRTSAIGDAANRFLWAGGRMVGAWPAAPGTDEYAAVRDSTVPTLLIGGTLDGATPAANATRELLPHLRDGHQVLLQGIGHTTDFWTQQVGAGNRLINGYLDRGVVDASGYVPQRVDFTPATTQTGLAKQVAGAMAGLAALTVLSLALMAWRPRRHGRLPRGTRVVARSAWALVAGLGGWAAGALAVLIAAPGVPVDAELLVLGTMAAPVALATYLGWRAPGRPTGRGQGLAAAGAGALAGAWVGSLAATGALALATTVVGAVAVANLALIGCEIAVESGLVRGRATPAR